MNPKATYPLVNQPSVLLDRIRILSASYQLLANGLGRAVMSAQLSQKQLTRWISQTALEFSGCAESGR